MPLRTMKSFGKSLRSAESSLLLHHNAYVHLVLKLALKRSNYHHHHHIVRASTTISIKQRLLLQRLCLRLRFCRQFSNTSEQPCDQSFPACGSR